MANLIMANQISIKYMISYYMKYSYSHAFSYKYTKKRELPVKTDEGSVEKNKKT